MGRSKCRWWWRWIFFAVLVMLILTEVVARVGFGLGNPPLFMADARIEYLAVPSAEYRRFGNRIYYNAYSMRSDDFPPVKSDPHELRVLVLGDSVVNGGALTDQTNLATTLLQKQLAEALQRPVVVGNASAGSWGPVNMLAYVEHFGLLDADILVVVLSSHDYADAPTYDPVVGVHPSYPNRRPFSALTELMTRYGRRVIPADPGEGKKNTAPAEAIASSLQALEDLIELAKRGGCEVIVAQHLTREELLGTLMPGHTLITQVAQNAGLEPVQFGPGFAEALMVGADPFRDHIHPNEIGQQIMAEVLFKAIIRLPGLRKGP